ncbi:MAG: type II toxin-antitoxin system VapC family toxin [Candidatus Asgardarchaeia archaeon]
MSIFIDTNIFVALRNEDDINHKRAKEIIKDILLKKFGTAYTSDYVFDEAVTVALIRTKNYSFAEDIGNYILLSKVIRLIYVDEDIFTIAWNLFKRLSSKRMSFTDCTNLAIMRSYNIKYIASFDTHFDGLANRIF